ncbi:MAG TPA: transporter substrate-binding domain-containing protein [Bacillota bacterium]|nr:transporter substrate-binding domain-containing protein [Bacillota bacterium]
MKNMTKLLAAICAIILAAAALGCSSNVPPNTVFSIDDLPGKVIGVQLGTTGDIYASEYEEPEDPNVPASKIERFKKGSEAVMALKQGKVDCVIIDSEPAKAFVAKNKDLKILDEPFAEEEYAICIAKDKTELKEKINAALAELKADGTLDNIIKNYIGDDTKGKYPYVSPEGIERSNGTLVMATNAAFEPYEYYENDKIVGIDVDLAQAIADKLGMELVINDMDFDAIIAAVQSGKADIGVAGMTITEDRLKSVDFTEPYTKAKQVIIVRAN